MSNNQQDEKQDGNRSWWQRGSTRKVGIGVGVVVAFGLGMCFGGGGETGDETSAGKDGHAHDKANEEVWTCPMHPNIRSPEAGKCPMCGMDLVELEDSAEEGDDPRRFTLSERAKVLARIRTERARPMPSAVREGRLLGRLDYDETRVKTVTAWTAGRIDRLRVATTGQRIRRGQVVATLFSPELYAAQSDLIQAARQLDRLTGGSAMAKQAAAAALESARQRLRLLGVTDKEIGTMEEATRPARQASIRSQFAGTVIERLVDEGSYVAAGSGLYRVADLSRLWVQLDAYESDLPFLRAGQPVTLDVTALPGKSFTGKITFIDPVIHPRKRTLRVRVEVENPDGELRPGMFAEAVVRGKPGGEAAEGILIPETAPLFTGRRSVVYVEVSGATRPTYEAREVVLGPKAGSHYPVVSGLRANERVVVNGAFAIDADLQIRGGASMMSHADDADRDREAPVEDLPPALSKALALVVNSYIDIQVALAGDDLATARAATVALDLAVEQASVQTPKRLREIWHPISKELIAHGKHLGGSKDIGHARHGFDGLSVQLIEILRRFGNPTERPLRLAFCPMSFDNRGAEWVQRGEEIRNSYFGAEMLTCGELRGVVEPGEHLTRPGQTPRGEAPVGGHVH